MPLAPMLWRQQEGDVVYTDYVSAHLEQLQFWERCCMHA